MKHDIEARTDREANKNQLENNTNGTCENEPIDVRKSMIIGFSISFIILAIALIVLILCLTL